MAIWKDFIPATIERHITPEIVFRPIRSWHSLTYAGERLRQVNGDGSGCLNGNDTCYRPLSVTHRMYWNTKTEQRISAFLSYPNGMGGLDQYFWEIYANDDIERYFDEAEMERRIIELIG